MKSIETLPAGHTLTVTPTRGTVHAAMNEAAGYGGVFSAPFSFGPFNLPRTFTLTGGEYTATVAEALTETAALIQSGSGAPVDAVRASLSVNPAGDENALLYTAVAYGVGGNAISIAYTDPGANDAALAVSVFGNQITVSLATGGAGAITSTAALVLAAIEASAAASALVTVAIDATDTGEADDGSGVVTAMAQDLLENGAGSLIGSALPGGLYIDTATGSLYRNTGTRAAPVWSRTVIGEFRSTTVAVGAAVSHTTNVAVNVCSLVLPAGEWDVSATVDRDLEGTTATRYAAGISLTTGTMPSQVGGSGLGTDPAVVQFATFGTEVTGTYATVIPPVRVVLTEEDTLFLVVQDIFSAGTVGAFGTIRARRVF